MSRKLLFKILLLACCLPYVTAAMALVAGIIFALFGPNPYPRYTSLYSKRLLHYSIIGLGFGLNLTTALKVTGDGFALTLGTIVFTFLAGWILRKAFRLDNETGVLISAGTAICGGSAIAAVSGVLQPNANKISLTIGVVFLLNSVALFLFPVIGHLVDLSQYQFGMWSAIAIHDTSSVLGAAAAYGDEALTTATTLKLSRALWIIPLTLVIALSTRNKAKITFPWFILGFIVSILIASEFPQYQEVYSFIGKLSKQLLVISLFLIGSSINLKNMMEEGMKTLLYGGILWVLISVLSLLLILHNF